MNIVHTTFADKSQMWTLQIQNIAIKIRKKQADTILKNTKWKKQTVKHVDTTWETYTITIK